jgi:hypothetical protein
VKDGNAPPLEKTVMGKRGSALPDLVLRGFVAVPSIRGIDRIAPAVRVLLTLRERLARQVPAAVVEAASQTVAGLESATGGARDQLATAILAAAESASPEAADLLRLEGLVLGMDFGGRDWQAHWGQPLIPTRTVDGVPFQVSDLPDEVEPYAARRSASDRPDVAARWNDVRWLRWRQFDAVAPAIDAYLAQAQATGVDDIEGVADVLGGLTRAADLALRLNQRRPEVCETVRVVMRGWAAADLTMPIMELAMATGGLLSVDPDAAKALAEELIHEAPRCPQRIGQQQLLEAAEHIAQPSGHHAIVKDARRLRAQSFEAEAAERPGLVSIMWLKQAIDLFGQIGDAEALERVQRSYEDAGREAQGELRVVSNVITIRREDIERQVDALTLGDGPSLKGYLYLPSELGFWRSWASVREDRQKEEGRFAFSALASKVSLEADGRIQPEPNAEDDREAYERARDISYFARQASMRAGLFETLLVELRNRGVWSAPLLGTAIGLIDEDLALACGPGITRFEADDYWSAGHVLVPQIERALRVLGRVIGADQTRFAANQGLRWATMDPILGDSGIVGAMGEDTTRAFAAVFTDAHGPNFRNNIAHGALATDVPQSAAALLALMAILAICYHTALARQPARGGDEHHASQNDDLDAKVR